MKKGNLFVYSGPSGVGKGTILDKIMEEDSNVKEMTIDDFIDDFKL